WCETRAACAPPPCRPRPPRWSGARRRKRRSARSCGGRGCASSPSPGRGASARPAWPWRWPPASTMSSPTASPGCRWRRWRTPPSWRRRWRAPSALGRPAAGRRRSGWWTP
ncbi:MAG: hypothetical protein AVDCRST_MAG88-2031, partial [uncultured Thermomicrobiales bacterium]